jgi:hypothetical protein
MQKIEQGKFMIVKKESGFKNTSFLFLGCSKVEQLLSCPLVSFVLFFIIPIPWTQIFTI